MLDVLRGRRLVYSLAIHDYRQFIFAGDVTLTVFNPMSFGPDHCSQAVEGAEVEAVTETADKCIIQFANGASISIDLSAAAMIGPEIMTLSVPGKPLVVWN